MESLKKQIKKILDGAKRIAVVGVGSELRGDDAAGLMVAGKLAKKLAGRQDVKVFMGATAPENLSGEIKRYRPTHIILIDAASMGEKTGSVRIFEPGHIKGVSFCTHQLPLSIFADYMAASLGCKVNVIGIQPAKLNFMRKPSRQIVNASDKTAKAIFEALP